MISVTPQIFFDRAKVVAAMNRKTQKVLSATGAFARQVMRRGMRRRRKASAPGDFPSSHAGQLRDQIYFGFDETSKSVVVGPLLFNSKMPGGKTVPQLLNEGGDVQYTTISKTGRKRTRRERYRPRPFIELTAPIAAEQLTANVQKFDLK